MFQMPYHRESILFRESYSDASVLQKNVRTSLLLGECFCCVFYVVFLSYIYIQINVFSIYKLVLIAV